MLQPRLLKQSFTCMKLVSSCFKSKASLKLVRNSFFRVLCVLMLLVTLSLTLYTDVGANSLVPVLSKTKATPAGSMGAAWNWLSPVPTREGILALDCVDTSTCYGTGTTGNIIKTSDGGANWTNLSSGNLMDLYGLSCSDATHCVTVGNSLFDGTAILTTNDGGQTWIDRTGTITTPLYAVDCPTTTTCYAGGDNNFIIKSTDGGVSWAPLTGVSGYFRGISCTDANTCYLSGQYPYEIAKTSDGGTIWSNVTPAGASYVGDINCPAAATCYMAGTDSSNNPVVFVTIDDGANWTSHSFAAGTTLLKLSCLDASSCFVGEAIFPSGSSQLGTVSLGYTGDSGATWTTKTMVTNAASPSIYSLSCPGTLVCYSAGFTIYATKDGGDSWSIQSKGLELNFHDLNCPTTLTCLAIGEDAQNLGTVMRTTDAGRNWDTYSTGSAGALKKLSCPTPDTCYALAQAGPMFISSDGGKNWTKLLSFTYSSTTLECQTTSRCVVGGTGNAYSFTTDSGQHWTQKIINIPNDYSYSYNFDSLSCPDSSSCYAVIYDSFAHNEVIVKSTDSGSNWNIIYSRSDVYADKLTLVCPDNRTCYLGGEGANVMVTTDGGSSWNTYTIQLTGIPGINIKDMACMNKLTCFGLTVFNIVGTFDGGKTWSLQNEGAIKHTLFVMRCKTGCYALGTSGAIISNQVYVDTGTSQELADKIGQAQAGQVLSLNPPGTGISLSSALPALPANVNLVGGDCGTPVTINGNHSQPGLVLGGANKLVGLTLLGMNGPALKADASTGGVNQISCVAIRQ